MDPQHPLMHETAGAASGGESPGRLAAWKTLAWVPAALGVDQFTKYLVVHRLALHEPVPILGDVVRLTHIHNAGAAFGMKLGGPLLHTLVAVVALGVLGWMFLHLDAGARWQRVALALVLGGALGNILDRLRLHYVVDFIDVGVAPGWRWPVFNLADSFVTVGVLVLALCYARSPSATSEDAPADDEPPAGESTVGEPAPRG